MATATYDSDCGDSDNDRDDHASNSDYNCDDSDYGRDESNPKGKRHRLALKNGEDPDPGTHATAHWKLKAIGSLRIS